MTHAASATLALACELIARPSVTPDDAGCQEILVRRLAPLGFHCETLRSGSVTNLWARRGNSRPLLCFAGHTDVVPPGPLTAWDGDPFTPAERDGFLHGRGAADMKGSIAAFVVAVEALLAERPDFPGSIALLITSDEEGPATDGTVKFVERFARNGDRLDYCVVGEPTSVESLGDMIKNGRRGTLSGHLAVHGVQGHVAYPHLARNPIHLLAPALTELAAIEWDRGSEYFPPTTWQCSNLNSGTGATNIIPGTLDLLFNFRYAPPTTRESLQQRLEEVLRRHGFAYELTWTGWGKPFLTPRGALVEAASAAILEVTGLTTALSCTGGTSDGRFIADICDQVVELGPVNATIHKVNERVRIADLDGLSAIYRGLITRLFLPQAANAASVGVP